MESKTDRIEDINRKIVSLILERRRAQRHNNWAKEEDVNKQIAKLETQITAIRDE